MKKLFTLFSIVLVIGANAQTKPTLVHYWSFNGVINSAFPNSPYDTSRATQLTPNISLVPSASINYAGAYTDWVNDSTNTVNERIPESNGVLKNALRLRSKYGPLTIALPTTGYNNIIVKYALFRSGSGANLNTVTYTTDGVTWDSTGLIISDSTSLLPVGTGTYHVTHTAAPLDSITLNFSNIAAVNNNPKFQIQINFAGATGGNDRIDNLTVESYPSPLAVSLQSFNGAIINKNAKLFWATTNEVNTKEFAIEASTNTKNFTQIGTVNAKNAKGTNSYEFESAATATTTYYRLKMIDKNGSFTYSSIVALNGTVSSKKLTAFPNPVVNSITLTHEQATAGAIVKILTVNGKSVSTSFVQTGASETSVDVSKLAKGSYIVSFENNGSKTTTQFVK